jgi:peptidoglycan/LPS O-acetylase OafA/YrhL
MPDDGRIVIVEALRGLAALAVAWFHVTNAYGDGWVRATGAYGWLGVDVFFVISGFIVPYSIARGFPGYTLREFPRFIGRRLLRLEPPYLLSIVVVLALWHASTLAPDFRGQQPRYETAQIAAHLLYLIPFTDFHWLQPVYWSLAYEFAFYLFIGLAFPWIGRERGVALWVGVAVAVLGMVTAGLLPSRSLLFILGFAVFRLITSERMGKGEATAVLALVTIVVIALWQQENWVTALTGLASAAAILRWYSARTLSPEWLGRVIVTLAAISYSLYLTHASIGGRVVNFGQRFVTEAWSEFGLSLLALAASLLFAWIFHMCVERPAIDLSRRLTSRQRSVSAPQMS